MRRLFSTIAILFAINIAMLAQDEVTQPSGLIGGLTIEEIQSLISQDVTQFMGIPVDGTKKEMIKKLKKKGFRKYYADLLIGEFNGRDVVIKIVTIKNKVCGIGVMDIISQNERDIKIRYNNLCHQFFDNDKYNMKKYESVIKIEDYIIPDDEDISYNIREHNKRYEATFHQRANMDFILSKGRFDNLSDLELNLITSMAEVNAVFNKEVSFYIATTDSGYKIMMKYVNVNNLSDGEDL